MSTIKYLFFLNGLIMSINSFSQNGPIDLLGQTPPIDSAIVLKTNLIPNDFNIFSIALSPLEDELFLTSINGKADFVARLMPNGGPKPFVKSELCTNCQLCVENCPKDLIDDRTKMFKDTMSSG